MYTREALARYFTFTVGRDNYICDVDANTSSVIFTDDMGRIRGLSYTNREVIRLLNEGIWKIKNIIIK